MTENNRFELTMSGNEVAQYEIIDHSQENPTVYNNLGNVYFSSAMKLCELLNNLENEKKQLKQSYKEFEDECQSTFNAMNRKQNDLYRENFKLKEENEQLKQRNDRQAKQLDRLYSLIEEKDWIALSDIINDFKRCEEQLQKEWGIYDESE